MRRSTSLATMLVVGLIAGGAGVVRADEPVTWELDVSHSTVGFSVRHMMITTVRGSFGTFSGKIVLTGEDPTSARLSVSVDTASVDTRDQRRDDHLRNEDFFHVEKYPAMTFESTKVERRGRNGLAITGDLTLRGVTRPVVLEVTDLTQPITDPWGNQRVGASATARIKRSDFGLTWNRALEAGGVVVADEVTISLDVQFIRQQ